MFANILFSGPCNARCPFCIGKIVDDQRNENNLNVFPLKNLDAFLQKVKDKNITEISLTGTNTDPLLYLYQKELIVYIRAHIPQAKISLHTNGRLLLQQQTIATLYDRISISLPSFDEEIYYHMMGVRGVPDIASIIQNIPLPIKISCIITETNKHKISDFIQQCKRLNIKRIVFRMPYQEKKTWNKYIHLQSLGWKKITPFANNPVYAVDGIEVTLRTFERSIISCLNLYSSGEISNNYLLH